MEKRSKVKVAMNYGAMYGLSVSVLYLIFYFAGAAVDSKAPQWLGYLLLIMFIYMGIKSYRDQDMDGYITYGNSLSTGVLIGLFGGIITGFFSVLMFTVIDPDLTQKLLDASQEKLSERGMTEDQIEMAATWTKKLMSPGILFIFSIIGSIFMSLIFSLIISFILKKDRPFSSSVDNLQ